MNDFRVMLAMRSKRSRWRAAAALAVLYAFCILIPHAALAFTHAAAHCLTEPHLVAQQAAPHPQQQQHATIQPHARAEAPSHAGHSHVQADGTVHTHPAPRAADDPAGTDGAKHGAKHGETCCGLFCVTAIAEQPAVTLAVPPVAAPEPPALETALLGCAPARINRPPIV
jgi:hypothetical protein